MAGKYTKMVIVLALALATLSMSVMAMRTLKEEEPKYEPQTFPGFPGGPPLGSGMGSSIPGFGLGQPGFGLPGGGGLPGFGSTPGLPGVGGGMPGVTPP